MKVVTEELPGCQVALTIEPDEKKVKEALRKAAREISRQYNVPGFRKGKAPYAAVVRTYGKEVLYEQIVEDLGDELLREALEESGLEPIGPGELDEVTFEPLVFRLILPMPPELDLGDYRSLRVERPQVEVSDEEVEEQLQAMQQDQGEWVPLEEEGAAYGDMVSMKLKGASGEETIIEDDAFELIMSEEGEDFPPGFDAQFVGKKAGDEVAFEITYPEDWPSQRAGEAAHFEAEILSVKRYDVPELDDDFAPLVGDFDTLDALRESIRQGMLEERQSASEHEYANQVMDKMIENAVRIEYPSVLLEDFLDHLLEEQASELQRSGLPFDEFLRMTGQSREAYRERLRDLAEGRLKGDLVLDKLVELERIEATDEEIDEQLEDLLEGSDNRDDMRQMLSSESGRAVIAQRITRSKVIDRLLAIADGTAPELSSDETEEEKAVAEPEAEAGAEPQP